MTDATSVTLYRYRMLDPETGICITYNGEAFNFAELS